MMIEYAQMLSTAHRVLDGDEVISESLYKVAHKNHPCTIWTRTNKSNYLWLFRLWKNLSMEYTERYDRLHLSWTKLNLYLQFHPRNIPEGELTEQPQCMPDYCKTEKDVIKDILNKEVAIKLTLEEKFMRASWAAIASNLFFAGYLFGIGFFLTGNYWISNSLQFDESFQKLIPLFFFPHMQLDQGEVL